MDDPSRLAGEADREACTLLAVGDMMFSQAVHDRMASAGDFTYPFAGARDLLASADLRFGNLETMITEAGRPRPGHPGVYKSDPRVAAALARVGFDAVSLAHNHVYNFGPEGVETTLRLLGEHGVAHVGLGRSVDEARRPLLVTCRGLRLGLLAYCSASTSIAAGNDYVTCPIREDYVAEDVAALKARTDFVVVTMHHGICEYPAPEFRRWAHAAVDAGAAVVLGHHPHVINGIESYGGGVIFYGLGDFIAHFDDFREEHRRGLAVRLGFGRPPAFTWEAIPTYIGEDFVVRPASGEKEREIRRDLEERSRVFAEGRADEAFWRAVGRGSLRTYVHDQLRDVRGQPAAVIWAKLRKFRPYHLRLIWRKLTAGLRRSDASGGAKGDGGGGGHG